MSIPSVTYALQNNLDFVALSHLDAGLYQVRLLFSFILRCSNVKLFSTGDDAAKGFHNCRIYGAVPWTKVLQNSMGGYTSAFYRRRSSAGSSTMS